MLTATAETLSRRFQRYFGYRPDIEAPRTFQEKILWRMLHEDMSEAVRLADKAAVRDYVRVVAGEQYLVETYAIVDDADDLNFDALPDRFVLKLNRTSGTNMFVQDKSQLNVDVVRRLLKSLTKLEYGRRLGEHWYASMPPRIVAERLLVDRQTVVPVDYRFHVFHGQAEFVQVVTQKRFIERTIAGRPWTGERYVDNAQTVFATYRLDWQPASFHFVGSPQPTPLLTKIPGPAAEMQTVAEKLAGDWGYVRVDLYCIDDRDVYFSEMTFAHNAGLFKLVPESYDDVFGGLWDTSRRYVRPEPAVVASEGMAC
jgi:hypothetical protein